MPRGHPKRMHQMSAGKPHNTTDVMAAMAATQANIRTHTVPRGAGQRQLKNAL